MAKKAAAQNVSASQSAVPAKSAAPRARKHVKAQAVVAAVEEFVTAIVHPEPRQEVATPEVAKAEPTHEDVSRLAYRLYLERGGRNGSQAEDWLRAEQTLRG